jgi:lysophospholipase L1-like esterase
MGLNRKHLAAAAVVLPGLLMSACGGGSSPTGPTVPSRPGTVNITVFYDENGNGLLDGGEVVRLSGVMVFVGGLSGRTMPGTGRTTIGPVPEGSHAVTVDSTTLPPFYFVVPAALTAQVPGANEVYVPCSLPIGSNRPNTYLAFGNSITDGAEFTDGMAYRATLQGMLRSHFGVAEVINGGVGATSSQEGAERIAVTLAATRPAYTLIHYGTNDFNKSGCRRVETIDACFTIPSLRTIVRETLAAGSLPCLATILPCNTGFDWRAPPQRNQWIGIQDERIRALAAEEGALLIDLETAFLQAGALDTLFVDHVHPNEVGFELMARTFFEGIVHGQTPAGVAPTAGLSRSGLLVPPSPEAARAAAVSAARSLAPFRPGY